MAANRISRGVRAKPGLFGLLVTVFASALSLASLAEARITSLKVIRLESPTFGGMTFGSRRPLREDHRARGRRGRSLASGQCADHRHPVRAAQRQRDGRILDRRRDPQAGGSVKGKRQDLLRRRQSRQQRFVHDLQSGARRRRTSPNTDADGAGTGLLMRSGYTLVWSGWEDTAIIGTNANLASASLPVARNPDGSSIVGQDDRRADLRQRDRNGSFFALRRRQSGPEPGVHGRAQPHAIRRGPARQSRDGADQRLVIHQQHDRADQSRAPVPRALRSGRGVRVRVSRQGSDRARGLASLRRAI